MTDDIPAGFTPIPFRSGFLEHIGPLYEKREGDGLVVAFRALDRHLNVGGKVHGGMLASIADLAMAYGASVAAGGGFFLTLDLITQFLEPGEPGSWIEYRPEVTRPGKTVFVSCRATAGDRLILSATGIFRRRDPLPGDAPASS